MSAPGRATAEGLTRLLVFAALVFTLPYLVIAGGPEHPRGRTWMICIAIAMWSGFRLAGLVARREPRLYEFMFFLFTYIFMGLAPAAQLYSNDMPTTTANLPVDDDLRTALVVVAGIAAFEMGRLLRGRRPNELGAAEVDEGSGSSFRTIALFWLAMPITLYMVKTTGVHSLFVSRLERDDIFATAFPDRSIGTIVDALSWVPALITVHRLGRRRRLLRAEGRRLRLSESCTLTIAFVVVVLLVNPISSARYVFGSVALSLVVLMGGLSTRRNVGRTLVMLLVAFFVLFPVADAFRRAGSPDFKLSLVSEYRGNGDYDAFGQIHNAVTVENEHGPQLLRQPIGIALFWVPRSVWPSKPEDTGIYLAKMRGYTFTNLSAPLWSEFYLIGGMFTVVLGFTAVGWLLARADDRLVRSFELGRPATVVASFMPFYLAILLRGSLLQATALVSTFLVSVWLTRAPAVQAEPTVARAVEAAAR